MDRSRARLGAGSRVNITVRRGEPGDSDGTGLAVWGSDGSLVFCSNLTGTHTVGHTSPAAMYKCAVHQEADDFE